MKFIWDVIRVFFILAASVGVGAAIFALFGLIGDGLRLAMALLK